MEYIFDIDELPNMLRTLRKQANLTLKEVSEQTGISLSFISEVERGRANPSIETLMRLSAAYGYDCLIGLRALAAALEGQEG